MTQKEIIKVPNSYKTTSIPKILMIAILVNIMVVPRLFAGDETYQVSATDISQGFIVKKISLTHLAIPTVTISGITFREPVTLPSNATLSDPENVQIILGMERKQPFAFVRIPAYSLDKVTGEIRQLESFKLDVKEDKVAVSPNTYATARLTGTSNSVLQNGKWYKIGITKTGFYKISFDFLDKSGINTSALALENIRVFGNGGHMLPEDNAVPRKNDLQQDAVWVNDVNNNGLFDKGDYVVFYGVGPTAWIKDSTNKKFIHQTNIYSDTAYYFLNFDGVGNRVTTQSTVPIANETVTDYNAHQVHELELENLGPYGREWWGEKFNGDASNPFTQSFSFDVGTTTSPIDFNIALGSSGPDNNNLFTVTINGMPLGVDTLWAATGGEENPPVSEITKTWTKTVIGNTANLTLTYQPYGFGNYGYLNYIELNYRCSLAFSDNQVGFRDWNSVGSGKVAGYQLQNANSFTQVWDVTDPQNPVKMDGTLSGSLYSFQQDASILHEFAAFNSDALYEPVYEGEVANQNIHGSDAVDLIIVTSPLFLDAANQLADFHRTHDHLRVLVATTNQVYNEFSSGAQDVCAIRDMTRMFYDRAGNDTSQMPRYLLLFGDASYDYKDRIANNSNYVPTFESVESHNPINSFASDDFFGFLDSNENIENTSIYNALDIGVGRLPIDNVDDANAIVNKIKVYGSAASLGPWRISATFVGDKEDNAGQHMTDAEDAAGIVNTVSGSIYNDTKVYVDVLPIISTPGGARCPNANQAIDDQVYKGTFFINYTGHGNTQVWSNERILTQDDYNQWNNITALPFTITATCDFGQFDNPAFVSAGEQLVMRNNGGVIAAITTTQQTYAADNRTLDENYMNEQFTRYADGSWNRYGDAFRLGKNLTYVSRAGDLSNFRKFSLLGDPAVAPDFPQYYVSTDSIIDIATGKQADSIKALGAYKLTGIVSDANKNVLTDFNGSVYVTIYDKPRTVNVNTAYGAKNFKVQDNVIYKGKVTVTNGRFSYSFVAPKDINYSYGDGKISYYAENGVTDGAGADTGLVIGGFSDNPVVENDPPIVKPFMNDTLFQDGGITGNNSVLYVQLSDETGINVSGNSIGHDLEAVLDGNIEVPYILNDFYQTLPNTYKEGYVSFPMNGLTPGKHTITVTAWDVNNNSGQGTVHFVVADSSSMQLQNLLAYPNPFRDVVHLVFDHNHPNEQLNVEVKIFNMSGVLVRTLKQTFTATGSRSDEVVWDGADDNGAKVGSGVYICRMKVVNSSGIENIAYQKVVLIR